MIAIPPTWIAYGLIAAAVGFYVWDCQTDKQALRDLRAANKAQEQKNQEEAELRNRLTEKRDAEHSTELARLGADLADFRLRDAARSPLPEVPRSASVSEGQLYCGDRKELVAGLRGLMAEARERYALGGKAGAELLCGIEWAADQALIRAGDLSSSSSSSRK